MERTSGGLKRLPTFPKMASVAVLASGGIESAAMLAELSGRARAVFPVYVRGGHFWEKAELYWLRRLLRSLRRSSLKPLSILDLPIRDCYRSSDWSLTGRRVPASDSPDEEVYLPGRNVLLLAKAGVFCAERGIGRLALGTLASNPFPDASPLFFRRMAGALSTGLGASLRVETPLRRLRKPQVLARFPALPWGLTFSCIDPKGLRHCGRCNKCEERRRAFERAGLPDPTPYRL